MKKMKKNEKIKNEKIKMIKKWLKMILKWLKNEGDKINDEKWWMQW